MYSSSRCCISLDSFCSTGAQSFLYIGILLWKTSIYYICFQYNNNISAANAIRDHFPRQMDPLGFVLPYTLLVIFITKRRYHACMHIICTSTWQNMPVTIYWCPINGNTSVYILWANDSFLQWQKEMRCIIRRVFCHVFFSSDLSKNAFILSFNFV